ncbi:MAG TPA: hypothetical protein VM076_21865 [Gemmatimonadaceae bacterium]|nr:hypothetical protein [Gemmatimonadaceae bacterium]
MSRFTSFGVLIIPLAAAASLAAQTPTPRLAFHLPTADSVRVVRDQAYKQGAAGPVRYDLYLPARNHATPFPVIVIVNGGQGAQRDLSLNVGWARLFAGTGLAAVTYDSDTSGATPNFDALVRVLEREAAARGIDPGRMGLWAGSGNASAALPIASDPSRKYIRTAALYYGAARTTSFRTDLPFQLVRVGLDQPALLHAQDSLIARALAANAPIEIINHPSGEHPFEEAVTRANERVVESTVAFLFHTLAAGFDGALSEQGLRAAAGAAAYAGDWTRAATAFQGLAERAPNDFELQRKLADARLAGGDAAGAIPAYLRSRELGHWRRGDIAIGLIAAYAQSGRREEAYAEISRLPATWNKTVMLANSPQLAAFRNDPEFVRRMR